MAKQGIRELVGRAMVDPGFLETLVQSPESTLADYELAESERAAVMQAVKQLAATPAARRVGAFQSALLRRLAT